MVDERAGERRATHAGERRRVTLLFCDLCDYTPLNELLDPEEIDELRRHVERAADDVIHKHGGAISQYYGDGILSVFGLPNASEYDVRAALDAALELRALTRDMQSAIALPQGFELRMHFGVHCGLVFVRKGDALHGRYELTGDVVNTASRLCTAAERDQILVSEPAMSGLEPFYEVEFVEGLALKGKRLSVPAFRLHHAHAEVRNRFDASARRGLTEFVNRHDELARLSRCLHEAARGGSRTTGLAGGPGIGKTRVLAEFARAHASQEVLILRATCENYGTVVPLSPLIQIVRQALRVRADTQPEQLELRQRCAAIGAEVEPYADLLANLLALETGARVSIAATVQRPLSDALCALFRGLRVKLVVLIIDDWQWVDDLSHQILRRVVREFERGLLMILAAREHSPDDAVLTGSELIVLPPLRPSDSTRVIRSLVPHPLDQDLTEGLYRRSGGNPLFLEELCRVLPSGLASGEALERTVPHTVHGVIQARLERLPARELELLRVASVIGNDFATSLLSDVAGRTDVLPVLEGLTMADLVRESEEPGSYHFKHGITREVVYESVLLTQRKQIHAAVAGRLSRRAAESGASPPHEALAHHYLGSAEHEPAAFHAELAGDRAAHAAALDRARVQYGAALDELDRLPQDDAVKHRWLAVSVKWARAWVYSPSPAQLDVLDRARRHAEELGDSHALSDIEQMGAWLCYALGEQEPAIAYCRRGLALAERAGNAKMIGQLTSNLGQSLAAAGEYAEAIPLLARAIELKRQGARGNAGSVPVGFAFGQAALATVHADQGLRDQAQEEMAQALDAVRGSGNAIEASMLALAAMIELWYGDWERCIATCAQASTTAERIHGPYVFTISQAMHSFSRFVLARDSVDYARLCSAAAWLEARGMGLFLSMVHGCVAEAALLANDAVRARDYAARALARAERRDPFGEPVAYRVLAELRARELPPGAAEVSELLARADQAAERRGARHEVARNSWARARFLLGAGEPALAQSAFETARGELQALRMAYYGERLEAELNALSRSAPPDHA